MGTIFSLISDDAIKVCEYTNYQCDLCLCEPAFYHSVETLYKGVAKEVDLLCSACIKLKYSKQYSDEWEFSLSLCHDYNKSKTSLEHTPKLPCFIQEIDWPVCCGELCEFTGIPKNFETEDIPNIKKFWFRGIKSYDKECGFTLKPEFLKDIGFFNCRVCSSEYFTLQFM